MSDNEEPKKERKVWSQGQKNKNNGNIAERKYARIFRKAGFDKAATARYASQLTDNCMIDLVFVPVNLQIKFGRQLGMKYHDILKSMAELVKTSFPEHYPERTNPNVLLHEKSVGVGNKRTEYDSIVSMTFETFFDLLCRLHDKGKYTAQVTILSDEQGVLQELPETPEDEPDPEEG